MFSLSTRFNIIFYNFLAGAAAMGLLNYLMAYFGPHTIKDSEFKMTGIDMFVNDQYLNEHAAAF